MKNSTSFILLVSSLAVSLTTTLNAEILNKNIDQEPAQVIYRPGSISIENILESSGLLLNRSSIARRLKVSDDHVIRSIYFRALEKYQDATNAYSAGNYSKAKVLALDSIQTIAKSVPRYYDRINKNAKRLAAKKP